MRERRVYYSFHEIHDVPYERGIRFGETEIIQILIAMAVLTLAFSFAFVPYPPLTHLSEVAEKLPFSFLAIVTAFFCHELAHKYTGQKYGYWSEFRMFPQGLLFAFFLGITMGIVFAAPGAVQIFGRPSREEMGKIAAAGPLTNILICVLFLLIWFFSGGYLGKISFFIAYINAFLAFFNLIPLGPLDGLKIFRWRKETWLLLIATALIIFILCL
jgi:Zn-dependent protease